MATELYITYGSTTVYLDRTNKTLLKYRPNAPKDDEVEDLTDHAEVVCSTSTKDELINAIELALIQARRYEKRAQGDRVYINFKPDGQTDIWRSPLIGGRVTLDDAALDWMWTSDNVKVIVALQRKPWFEGPEEQLDLYNGNAVGGSTTGKVYNCNDGTGTSPNKKNNWLQILNEDIEGILPARCRLELTNTYSSAIRNNEIWIGLNAFADPENFIHHIEAEDAWQPSNDTANGNASGGYYNYNTTGGDVAFKAFEITLSSSFMSKMKGRSFRLLASNDILSNSGVYVHCRTLFPTEPGITILEQGSEYLLDTRDTQDIGTLKLPPWVEKASTQSALSLQIWARKTGGCTYYLDAVHFMPLDSFRVLWPKGYGQPQNYTIVDDSIEDMIYTTSGTAVTGHYIGYGRPFELFPGQDNFLYFLWNPGTILRTMEVEVYYRPRRYTV